MFTFRPTSSEQYNELLALTREAAGDYLDTTLRLLGIDWTRYAELFRIVGQVYGIYDNDDLAGFYWIEERDEVLHIHGIILKEGFRGRGIGSQVIERLAEAFLGRVRYIELGVHQSNRRAKALFERHGFQVAQVRDDVGFYIMRKPLGFRLLP